MATVFLSHASRDDELASQLEAWLVSEGFDDLFVDHSDIRGGDKWTEALRRAKGSCRVVLCLVTQQWLASDECFGEFTASWYAGQRIVPLLAADPAILDERQTKRLGRVLGEDQGFDLKPALSNGLLNLNAVPTIAEPLKAGLRAGGALAKIGLDPEAFEVDTELRPEPFPGLQSYGDTDADAAIFFGRSPEIARCLEELREMRAGGVRQPYALLGASGSGKSSLLKAGVLPRLRREHGWLGLRTFRPGTDPLYNFAESIALSLAEYGETHAPGTVRDTLLAAWEGTEKKDGFATETGLRALRQVLDQQSFAPLRLRTNRPAATVLLPLDQAEELARGDGKSADALCDYLRAALLPAPSLNAIDAPASGAMIAFTCRSDSFPELQTAPRFTGLDARCTDIRSVPLHRFDDAIEKPAARYGVQIEAGLVDAMIEEVPSADSLPLFAFALQRLWRQYHESKLIRRANYEQVGRLNGLIEDAAERALSGIRPGEEERSRESRVSVERDQLAARTFIPPLAQVSETGEPIRRVAVLKDFDTPALELLEHFVEWRLVVSKGSDEGGGSSLEVAHEAIFRGWPRFQRWLEPQKARMEALRALKSAARMWDQHKQTPAYIDHRGRRLKEARALRDDPEFNRQIESMERNYLVAAMSAQRRQRGKWAGGALAIVSLGFIGFAGMRIIADRDAFIAEANRSMDRKAERAAARYALAGLGGKSDLLARHPSANDPLERDERAALGTGLALRVLEPLLRQNSDFFDEEFSADDSLLFIRAEDGTATLWDARKGIQLADLGSVVVPRYTDQHEFFPDGERLLIQEKVGWYALWDARAGIKLKNLGEWQQRPVFSPDGMRMMVLAAKSKSDAEDMCSLWDSHVGTKLADLGSALSGGSYGSVCDNGTFSADGARLVFVDKDHMNALWDAHLGKKLADLGQGKWAFSPDGGRLVMEPGYLIHTLWDARAGTKLADLGRGQDPKFSADGSCLLAPSGYSAIIYSLWDAHTGRRISDLDGFGYASCSPNGTRVFTSGDHNTRASLWDARDGKKLFDLGERSVTRPYFSPGGAVVATISNDTAMLWDAQAGRKLADLGQEIGDRDKTFKYSNDASRLAFTSLDGTTTLWDAHDGHKLADLGICPINIMSDSVSFSPDDGRLIFIGMDGKTSLWDAHTGHKLANLWRLNCKFSPDGGRLLCRAFDPYSNDSKFTLWDAHTGHKAAEIGHLMKFIRFSADGLRLVGGGTSSSDWGGHDYILQLALDDDLPPRGAELKGRMCDPLWKNREIIGPFAEDERLSGKTEDKDLSKKLIGRPWHPCDWQGLRAWEGWKQTARYWMVHAGLYRDYQCGETTAFGDIDPEAESLCRKGDDRVPK